MKVNIELESDDALTLCSLAKVAMDEIVEKMGEHPLLYSKGARVTNEVVSQVYGQVTPVEMAEILKRRAQERL